MGANNYTNYARNKSMQDAYRDCVNAAEEEYGHQEGYSGQINNSNGFVDKTAMWKASKLKLEVFINKYRDANGKGEAAWGICYKEPVPNNNKVKSTVAHDVFKGTRKWELVYVAQEIFSDNWYGKQHKSKADAVKEARAHTEKTGNTTIVAMEKVLSKDSGSAKVARIEYKSNPKEERGSYVFFGLANC